MPISEGDKICTKKRYSLCNLHKSISNEIGKKADRAQDNQNPDKSMELGSSINKVSDSMDCGFLNRRLQTQNLGIVKLGGEPGDTP